MASQFVLFDIPDKNGRAWSFNTWKTRLALNYKGVDYKTEWLEYPEIGPRLKAAGVEGDSEQYTPYTCPTVQFPDGTYVMDSAKIAKRLEEEYPERPLDPKNDLAQAASQFQRKIWGPLQPVLMPEVYRTILGERSKPFFWDTRKKDLGGMTIYEFENDYGGEKAWEKVKLPLQEVSALLNKTEGPFFQGSQVSYADFILVGFLEFVKKYAFQHYQRIIGLSNGLDKLHEACLPWLERDD
ncbi:hypothetical protein COL154_013259 [Colletotrichum chrysophilum]|nr:hypothetical protein COL154_013259 [Colletotrichum chrysophilum]